MSVVLNFLSFKSINLTIQLQNSFASTHHFIFKSLGHSHLALEVFAKIPIVIYLTITFPLEDTQLLNGVGPSSVKVGKSELRFFVFVLLGIELHLQVSVYFIVHVFFTKHPPHLNHILLGNIEFLSQVAAITVHPIKLL